MSSTKRFKRSGKSASSTSEGSVAHHKDKPTLELELESIQSTTVQEVSVSSSVEGPVLPEDSTLVCLSARFSRTLQKNKLQPSSTRRAVRMIEALPPMDLTAIDEWGKSMILPTCNFLAQSSKAAKPGENFVCNVSFSGPTNQQLKLASVTYHKPFGSDGVMFFVQTEDEQSFYFVVRLVINETILELASTLSVMEADVSDADATMQTSRWLDTGLNPSINAYYQPQGLTLKRFKSVADDRRSLYLPFIISTLESEQYKGRKYRLLFNVIGDSDTRKFSISKSIEVGENAENSRRQVAKHIVQFLQGIKESIISRETHQLLSQFVSAYPKTVASFLLEENGCEPALDVLLEALKSMEPPPNNLWTRQNYDGKVLLHYIASMQAQDLLQYIIQKDPRCVNMSDLNSQTPLWEVIDNNSPSLIDILAKNGANLKMRDLRGYNALEFARSRRPIRHHVIRTLNSYLGSSTTSEGFSGPEKRVSSRTRTNYLLYEQTDSSIADNELSLALGATETHTLAFHGRAKRMSELLSKAGDVPGLFNQPDMNGTTSVHQAVRAGKQDIFNALINCSDIDLDTEDILSVTPLNLACYYNRIEMVKALVAAHGHNDKPLKSLTSFDSFNYSPLHTASSFGYSDILNLLLEAIPKEDIKKLLLMPELRVTEGNATLNMASSHQKRKVGESPYYLASANGHTTSLKLLIEYDKDFFVSAIKSAKGSSTPLHVACRRGHKDVVALLLKYKVDASAKDSSGATPAHFAARFGHAEVLSTLLKKGIQLEDKDANGYTALHMAAIGGHSCCLKILIDAGANMEAVTKKGETALCLAIACDHVESIDFFIKLKANINHVLKKPQDTKKDDKGKEKEKHNSEELGVRPVHLAAERGKAKILQMLVDADAEINARDEEGKTPLMLSVHNLACLSVLIHRKAIELDAKDNEGRTALFHALSSMYIKAGKELIMAGCNTQLKNNNGVGPLDLDLKNNKDVIMDVVKTRQEKSNTANEAIYKEAVALFNQKASLGIEHLNKAGVLKNPAWDLGWFFANFSNNLSKIQLGAYLGGEDELNIATLHAFTNRMDFSEMTYDRALRSYLYYFMLPGEAQKIDRIMECFAHRYHQNNAGVFPDADTAFILAFSLIMLNTDLHNPNIKNKMTKEQFLRNNRGQWGPDHQDPPKEFYSRLYDAISGEEIEFEREGYMFGGAEKKGYLKKFSPPRAWTKRYFILKESCLYYFRSSKDEEPYGIIVLENISVAKVGTKRFSLSTKDGSSVKYCKTSSSGVMVQGLQKEIILCADTEAQRNEWISSLQTNVTDNPFYEMISKRIDHLMEKAQSTQEVYLTPEHIKQYAEWTALCTNSSKELREKWGDSLTLCSAEGNLKYVLIEDGKVTKIAFTQDLWVPELIQHVQKNKTTKFDFMEHFQISSVLDKISKVILPNIRKHAETQLCGYGLGSIIAIQMGLLLQSQGYTVKRILTFGQPKSISAKDFSSCNLLGLVRILLPKDPALHFFDNHAHAGQQLILTSKPQLESVPNFGDQVSVPMKVPKNILKKGTTVQQEFSLSAYSKALSHVKF